MATKQVIEIDVTFDAYRKLNLNGLITYVAGAGIPIKRMTIREKK